MRGAARARAGRLAAGPGRDAPGPGRYTLPSTLSRKGCKFAPEGPPKLVPGPEPLEPFSGVFGYGCDIAQHVAYGQCMDGLCGRRAPWEGNVPGKLVGLKKRPPLPGLCFACRTGDLGAARRSRVPPQRGEGRRGAGVRGRRERKDADHVRGQVQPGRHLPGDVDKVDSARRAGDGEAAGDAGRLAPDGAHHAADGSHRVMKLLLDRGADVTVQDGRRRTPQDVVKSAPEKRSTHKCYQPCGTRSCSRRRRG